MKNISLPKSYKIAKYIHLTKRLTGMPAVTKGVHRGRDVYRVRSGGKTGTFLSNSKTGLKAKEVYEKREQILAALKELEASCEGIENEASGFCITPYEELQMGKDFYFKAKAEASPHENRNRYVLNGVNYRSRAELVIAQVLTDLGLQFKYDCEVLCNDIRYTADFLVYLPEFGRCFMIEYLGRLDDEGYSHKNSIKLRDYLSCGYYFGTDLLVFCGNEVRMPTIDQIRGDILHIVDTISLSHLTTAKAFTF
ncbi:MAG: hypothetical protein J5883_08435 [Clostridiales bacterium]|nr:hypothetical protein [Clostridiales bacterium]